MKKRNKYKNEDQLKLSLQNANRDFLKKELNSLAQSAGVFRNGIEETAQSKGLSKNSSLSKIKESVCGKKQPQAVFFDNLISVKTVAERLGLAPKTIHNWVYLRKIPYVKYGNKVMFRPKSLKAWLNRKEIKSWQ